MHSGNVLNVFIVLEVNVYLKCYSNGEVHIELTLKYDKGWQLTYGSFFLEYCMSLKKKTTSASEFGPFALPPPSSRQESLTGIAATGRKP